MVRTQIQITELQRGALRQLAAEKGRSLSELVREGIAMNLESQLTIGRAERVERARRSVGRFSSGLGDVSTEHDRYLAEAFKS